jgi:hypothetical protein
MKTDMHYYGTLAIAIAAGIPKEDAEIIAYAAQFTDDSTGEDSAEHRDHGLLYGTSTAHHPIQSFLNRIHRVMKENTEEQRKIWVPFHFLPGGKGKTLSEKLLCVKNSPIVQEMFSNNLQAAVKKNFGLELLGITAHVYMDTFAHYGFSGIASSYNEVENGSIEILNNPNTKKYIEEKFKVFVEKTKASVAQMASKALGHAGVATHPDRPYLRYKFQFTKPRPDSGCESVRNNAETFLEGCRNLHQFFSEFARNKYAKQDSYKEFSAIEASVNDIIHNEADCEGRIEAWKKSGLIADCKPYDPNVWQEQKINFSETEFSMNGINTNAYRFHQAAVYHRYYVLKDLLPAHGIAVY